MNTIHRKEVEFATVVEAPANVTFGYQEDRMEYSLWYKAGEPETSKYMRLQTGNTCQYPIKRLVGSVCADGYHMEHLVELEII